jgi:(E)-4-hydroxy-3-methylbut-2-enyl-diphosphate synthase
MFSPVVSIGHVRIGGRNPVAIQSMTSTDTACKGETVQQILELENAGSELVRIPVDCSKSAQAVPYIYECVRRVSQIPLIGDFHFNGHILLKRYPEVAMLLEKYRINPGNIGRGDMRDRNFEGILEIAAKYKKPIRIGGNGGSLDPELLQDMMDKNRERSSPKSDREVFEEALVESVVRSANFAYRFGIPKNKIILSAKVSNPLALIRVYNAIIKKTNFCLHIGLTEAGSGLAGVVSSVSAVSPLLLNGIGDTLRISLTPKVGESRTKEVLVAKEILQSLGLRRFSPRVISCPGCGRTAGNNFQFFSERLTKEVEKQFQGWKQKYPGCESLRIAVMGCIVNGPGEGKNADIGIFFPGKGEGSAATIFLNGVRKKKLFGKNILQQFLEIVEQYLEERKGI